MEVHAVVYHKEDVSEELYLEALNRVSKASQERIRRFYRKEDSCRTLIGELLIRLYLQESQFSRPILFDKTEAGKPYLSNQDPTNPISFNITHDNALIAAAFSRGHEGIPAYEIGIDIMKTRVPTQESFGTFLEAFEDQLTDAEHTLLASEDDENEKINLFFWMWTLKEAYTKALGLGLGFDFSRVEFIAPKRQVNIDGRAPKGWRFTMFTVPHKEGLYEGVVAEHVGGNCEAQVHDESHRSNLPWLRIESASAVLQRAVDRLPVVS